MKNIAIMNNNSFGLDAEDYVDNIVLAAGVAKTVTKPADATHCFFSATNDFFARFAGTPAVVPSGDITDGTGSVCNPTVRTFAKGAGSFSVISASACILSLAWYRS